MPNPPNGYQPDTTSESSRRADFDLLRRIKRLERNGGGGGDGGSNEVTIGGSAPSDTSELWVDSTPAIQAKIGGVWTPVGGPAGPQGPPGNVGQPGPPGPQGPPGSDGGGGAEEVWIGASAPTDPAIELWFDVDAVAPTIAATMIIAVPYVEWPPASPQPGVLYLRITP